MVGRGFIACACLAAVVTAGAGTAAPPAGVTTKAVSVKVPGRSFPARLWYPTGGGPYPTVVFAHGYGGRASWYGPTLRAVAAAGYVVVAPDSETGRFPNHIRFADDLIRSARWLRAGTSAVPRGKADTSRVAVAGHSMGGGVALLAATRSPVVDTVISLAAADTAPVRASVAVRRLRVPSLFLVGSDDRIVPAAGTAVMFRRAPSPSLLANIVGGSHCGFMNTVLSGCDAGSISYARQLELTRETLRRWLERHLLDRKNVRVTGLRGIEYVNG